MTLSINGKTYEAGELIAYVKELEKENAELKADDQLIKAKEIIKTCLGFMQAFGYSPSIDKLVTEAEQFLKEVEK